MASVSSPKPPPQSVHQSCDPTRPRKQSHPAPSQTPKEPIQRDALKKGLLWSNRLVTSFSARAESKAHYLAGIPDQPVKSLSGVPTTILAYSLPLSRRWLFLPLHPFSKSSFRQKTTQIRIIHFSLGRSSKRSSSAPVRRGASFKPPSATLRPSAQKYLRCWLRPHRRLSIHRVTVCEA